MVFKRTCSASNLNVYGFELKYRREAAEFIQEMAERLNHNIEDNWQSASLQQEDNCLVAFIWLVHVQFMRSRPIDDDDPLDNFLMLLWMQHS
uniref:Uncharacterized protein n=1 Tax=Meloidogyne incognita TaxID=6306 RepID=A0A914KMZ6_MELIC